MIEGFKFYEEVQGFMNQYDYRIQAIFACLIIQSVPVLLMSLTYSLLSKNVTNLENSALLNGMYAFTFGALMGDVFMHIMPSLNLKASSSDHEIYINMFVVAGVIL